MHKLLEEPFDKWYAIYPRKVGKGAAKKAFARVVNRVGWSALMEATKAHAECSKNTETQFIPHPATWLNQERWDDEPDLKPSSVLDGISAPTSHKDWTWLLLRGAPLKKEQFAKQYVRGNWPMGREGMGPNPFHQHNKIIPQSVWDEIGPIWGWQ